MLLLLVDFMSSTNEVTALHVINCLRRCESEVCIVLHALKELYDKLNRTCGVLGFVDIIICQLCTVIVSNFILHNVVAFAFLCLCVITRPSSAIALSMLFLCSI